MSRYVAQPDGPVVVLGLDVISHALHESYGDSAYDAGAWLATLLRELSSIVTLALYTTDSAADSRRSLLAGGLYDLFGDLRLVGGMDDLARMKQMLDLQPDESRLFVVGPGAAPLFAGAEGYVYVPGLTLLYGALAGQEIVLADVRYDGRMGREARQRLARSSVLPVYHADHHEPDERFVMYLCEGSRTQLEMAGFSVTQLADASVAGTSRLYGRPPAQYNDGLSAFEVFSDPVISVLAVPMGIDEKIVRRIAGDQHVTELVPSRAHFDVSRDVR